MDTNLLAGQSSIWVQPDGPNTEPKYLGCHGIGDITEPMGDITLLYCPDPNSSGDFTVKNSFKGAPGAITTSIETDMRKTADYLEYLKSCSVPIYVMKVQSGRRDVFTNFDRAFILGGSLITSRVLGSVAARNPADNKESTQKFDVSARVLRRVFNLEGTRVPLISPQDVTGIAIVGSDRCEGGSGPAQKSTDDIFVSTKSITGSVSDKANVLRSVNGGTYTQTAADPFGSAEDIQGIVGFNIGRTTVRLVVARGTTDAAAPAEVAYSDDNGVTWSTVNVGTINGEFVSNGHALFALDRYHIWVGTNSGNIYFSSDAGLIWVLQEPAAISVTPITGINFADAITGYVVYTGGLVGRSIDGATWSAVSGSTGATATTDVHTLSAYSAWISGSNGIRFTKDGGATWAARSSTPIGAIDFMDELIGFAVGSATGAPMYLTVNGGYDWMALPTITNGGFLDVKIVNPSEVYIVGKISSVNGMIVKAVPQS